MSTHLSQVNWWQNVDELPTNKIQNNEDNLSTRFSNLLLNLLNDNEIYIHRT